MSIILLFIKIHSAMRQMFDWLMAAHHMMDEWRYASMGFGVQCVPTIGMPEMLKWCVGNWVMMDVSAFSITMQSQ